MFFSVASYLLFKINKRKGAREVYSGFTVNPDKRDFFQYHLEGCEKFYKILSCRKRRKDSLTY